MQRSRIIVLLEHPAIDLESKTVDGHNALHYAAMGSNETILEMLLDRGVDINSETSAGWTALHFAVSSRRETNVALLLQRGADVNAKTKYGHNILDFAITRANLLIIKMILASNAYKHDKESFSPPRPSLEELVARVRCPNKEHKITELLKKASLLPPK